MSRTQTHQVPIDSVSLDQLPQETPLNYDEIAKLVGSLYIDANHRVKNVQGQAKSLIESLQGRVNDLTQENSRLKEELQRQNNGNGHNRAQQLAQHGNEAETSKNNIGPNQV